MLHHIRISIITWAYYVPIDFKVSSRESTGAGGIAIPFFVFPEPFEEVIEKIEIRIQMVAISFGISFRPRAHLH